MISDDLLRAAHDLRWLSDRGYPQTASVKLVGDRWRLDRAQRQMLFRGVSAGADAAARRSRLADRAVVAGSVLGVDGHNVVLTLANYIAGVPVFEADDGLVRDIGALHGRVRNEALMRRCLDLLCGALTSLSPDRCLVVFDAPVSHSRDHAALVSARLAETDVMGRAEAVPSGDQALKNSDITVVATSDSALIDAMDGPVFDLARHILESEFAAVLPSFLTGEPSYTMDEE